MCEDCDKGCLKIGRFAGSSHQNMTGKWSAEKWHKQLIEFKENMVEKLQKTEGGNKELTQDINNMRAVINTSAPSLGEEQKKILKI